MTVFPLCLAESSQSPLLTRTPVILDSGQSNDLILINSLNALSSNSHNVGYWDWDANIFLCVRGGVWATNEPIAMENTRRLRGGHGSALCGEMLSSVSSFTGDLGWIWKQVFSPCKWKHTTCGLLCLPYFLSTMLSKFVHVVVYNSSFLFVAE